MLRLGSPQHSIDPRSYRCRHPERGRAAHPKPCSSPRNKPAEHPRPTATTTRSPACSSATAKPAPSNTERTRAIEFHVLEALFNQFETSRLRRGSAQRLTFLSGCISEKRIGAPAIQHRTSNPASVPTRPRLPEIEPPSRRGHRDLREIFFGPQSTPERTLSRRKPPLRANPNLPSLRSLRPLRLGG